MQNIRNKTNCSVLIRFNDSYVKWDGDCKFYLEVLGYLSFNSILRMPSYDIIFSEFVFNLPTVATTAPPHGLLCQVYNCGAGGRSGVDIKKQAVPSFWRIIRRAT